MNRHPSRSSRHHRPPDGVHASAAVPKKIHSQPHKRSCSNSFHPREERCHPPHSSSHSERHAPMEKFFQHLESHMATRLVQGNKRDSYATTEDVLRLYRSLLHESSLQNDTLQRECRRLRKEVNHHRQRERVYAAYVEALEKVVERLANEKLTVESRAPPKDAHTMERTKGHAVARDRKVRKETSAPVVFSVPPQAPVEPTRQSSHHQTRDTPVRRPIQGEQSHASDPDHVKEQQFYSAGKSPFSRVRDSSGYEKVIPHEAPVHTSDPVLAQTSEVRKATKHNDPVVTRENQRRPEEKSPTPLLHPPRHQREDRATAASTGPSPNRSALSAASVDVVDEAELVDELLALMQRRVRKDQRVVASLFGDGENAAARDDPSPGRYDGGEGVSGDRSEKGQPLVDGESEIFVEAEEGPGLRNLRPSPTSYEHTTGSPIKYVVYPSGSQQAPQEPPLSKEDLFGDLGLITSAYAAAGPTVSGNTPSRIPPASATRSRSRLTLPERKPSHLAETIVAEEEGDRHDEDTYFSDEDSDLFPDGVVDASGRASLLRRRTEGSEAGSFKATSSEATTSDTFERDEGDEEEEDEEEDEFDADLEASRAFDEWKQRLEELLSQESAPNHP